MNEPKIDDFLNELSALTQKYGIEIGGCGCCGSPWLCILGENYFVGDQLGYDEKSKHYEISQ